MKIKILKNSIGNKVKVFYKTLSQIPKSVFIIGTRTDTIFKNLFLSESKKKEVKRVRKERIPQKIPKLLISLYPLPSVYISRVYLISILYILF